MKMKSSESQFCIKPLMTLLLAELTGQAALVCIGSVLQTWGYFSAVGLTPCLAKCILGNIELICYSLIAYHIDVAGYLFYLLKDKALFICIVNTWLTVVWWIKEPGHRQPWYLPIYHRISYFHHQMGLKCDFETHFCGVDIWNIKRPWSESQKRHWW